VPSCGTFFQQIEIEMKELFKLLPIWPNTPAPPFAEHDLSTIRHTGQTQLSWLRETVKYLDFCDELNLDAVIEPWRPIH